MQKKQQEWAWQWDHFYDNNQWLFTEWIAPNTLEDFRNKSVLDCGCGGGQHINFVAPFASRILGVDLNALSSAKKNTENLPNVELLEADIANMNIEEKFDMVYCIGVLHHTDKPVESFKNISRHCKSGGRVIVWVYSYEGNFLNRIFVEGAKKVLLKMPRIFNMILAHILTILIQPIVWTLYLLPLTFLPYYEYFQNWRKLPYMRNVLNIFDKLNAPQTFFIKKSEVEEWFNSNTFTNIHISPYKGVSWRASGTML